MTTAHRPTFNPAVGKSSAPTRIQSSKALPAHTQLKYRLQGQNSEGEVEYRDLRQELLEAEATYFRKRGIERGEIPKDDVKLIENTQESESSKRRKLILEQAREEDADSASGSDDSEDDSDEESDSEDEEAQLMRELAKIRKEREDAAKAKEAQEAQKQREKDEEAFARKNPLLNDDPDFSVKRRWDDDVVFKNQAKKEPNSNEKRFVNDLLRTDFHRKFMNRYVR